METCKACGRTIGENEAVHSVVDPSGCSHTVCGFCVKAALAKQAALQYNANLDRVVFSCGAPAYAKHGGSFALAAGVLFLLCSFSSLSPLGGFVHISRGIGLLSLLVLFLLYAGLSVCLFAKSRIGAGVCAAALSLLLFLFQFILYRSLNPMSLLNILAMLSLSLVFFTGVPAKAKPLAFLPAALRLVAFLYESSARGIIPGGSIFRLALDVYNRFLYPLLLLAAFILAGLWLIYTAKPRAAANNRYGANPGAVSIEPKGYTGLCKHFLLLVFTFGIWQLIWIYRSTEFLNRAPGEPPRNPTTKLLLCLFVPFYYIYWVYRSAQRVDKLLNLRGIPSNGASFQLLMAFFIPGICPIMLQDKINTIALFDANRAPRPRVNMPPQQPAEG